MEQNTRRLLWVVGAVVVLAAPFAAAAGSGIWSSQSPKAPAASPAATVPAKQADTVAAPRAANRAPQATSSAGSESGSGSGAGVAPPPVPSLPAPPAGPWPVEITAAAVTQLTGQYCGGSYPRYESAATLAVPVGPVTLSYQWRLVSEDGGVIGGLQQIDFPGTGPQTAKVSQQWNSVWDIETLVRLEVVNLQGGPGGEHGYQLPPPRDLPLTVPACTLPDIQVTVLGAQVVPQKCATGLAQVVVSAQVSLGDQLDEPNGPVRLAFRWLRNGAVQGDQLTLEFVPGGPQALVTTTVWTLPAAGTWSAGARVHPQGFQFTTFTAPPVEFTTFCIP